MKFQSNYLQLSLPSRIFSRRNNTRLERNNSSEVASIFSVMPRTVISVFEKS